MSVRNEREPPPGASHEVHDKHSLPPEDAAARALASDPTRNVVLEASAGTGKTSVLVARYLNLLRAGVEPSNVLAITFTRQAAAEMRERIITELQAAAEWSAEGRSRWAALALGRLAGSAWRDHHQHRRRLLFVAVTRVPS